MPADVRLSDFPQFPVNERSNVLLTRKEQRAARREEQGRDQPRRHRLLKAIGSFAMTTTLLYGLDVAHGEKSLQNSRSEVVSVFTAHSPADANKAIVDSAGWGNLSAYDTAAALPTFADEGNVWAIRYDNTGIDTDKIAEQLVEKAKAENVDELSFSGHSMGGLIDLEVARKIYEGDNDITIPYIVLDCTPASIDAVRPNVRSDGYTMVQALSYIPGARESSAVRFVAEEAARFHQYEDLSSPYLIDPAKFVDATKRVIDQKFLDDDAASTSLLDSQFQFIVASGAKNNIMALGKDRGKQKPILVFLRPEDAADDATVDDDFSQHQFEDYAQAAGLTLMVIDVPGIGHANPIQRPTQYNTALVHSVLPKIAFAELMAQREVERAKARLQEAADPNTSILSDPTLNP